MVPTGKGGGQAPGHVVGGTGRVAPRGDAGLHAVRALQAQCVVRVLALIPTLPPSWQVVQDGVVHKWGEARGAHWERGCPVQGIPLALCLSRCFLLQLSQPPPLLLNYLLPCRRDRRGSEWHLPGRTLAVSQTEVGDEQGEVNTWQSPRPTSFPEAPTAPGPATLPMLQSSAQLAIVHRLASALFLHPEPTQGTEPGQHDSCVALAHKQGLTGQAGYMHHHACWRRQKPMSTQGFKCRAQCKAEARATTAGEKGRGDKVGLS